MVLQHQNKTYNLESLPQSKVNITYQDEEGRIFSKLSEGVDFSVSDVIPSEQNNSLLVQNNESDSQFAHFEQLGRNVLTMPSIGLTLSTFQTANETAEAANEEANATISYYNYDLHGADWPEAFPACGSLEFQSPINLLPPITKYGKSYKILSAAVDSTKPEYSPVYNATLNSF